MLFHCVMDDTKSAIDNLYQHQYVIAIQKAPFGAFFLFLCPLGNFIVNFDRAGLPCRFGLEQVVGLFPSDFCRDMPLSTRFDHTCARAVDRDFNRVEALVANPEIDRSSMLGGQRLRQFQPSPGRSALGQGCIRVCQRLGRCFARYAYLSNRHQCAPNAYNAQRTGCDSGYHISIQNQNTSFFTDSREISITSIMYDFCRNCKNSSVKIRNPRDNKEGCKSSPLKNISTSCPV